MGLQERAAAHTSRSRGTGTRGKKTCARRARCHVNYAVDQAICRVAQQYSAHSGDERLCMQSSFMAMASWRPFMC